MNKSLLARPRSAGIANSVAFGGCGHQLSGYWSGRSRRLPSGLSGCSHQLDGNDVCRAVQMHADHERCNEKHRLRLQAGQRHKAGAGADAAQAWGGREVTQEGAGK